MGSVHFQVFFLNLVAGWADRGIPVVVPSFYYRVSLLVFFSCGARLCGQNLEELDSLLDDLNRSRLPGATEAGPAYQVPTEVYLDLPSFTEFYLVLPSFS